MVCRFMPGRWMLCAQGFCNLSVIFSNLAVKIEPYHGDPSLVIWLLMIVIYTIRPQPAPLPGSRDDHGDPPLTDAPRESQVEGTGSW